MELRALTQAVKTEAQRLGFHLVGVTTPDPPPHLAVFEYWLDSGRHGEMGYLDAQRSRQRRADPRQILPECASILVLGMRYANPETVGDTAGQREPQPHGRVAAYAWGSDYHDVFPGHLRTLVAFIETQVGRPVPNRCYSDTGPILERDLAQRAGLGWIGKNTCLINPELGSYFLLAEILLGLELEPDLPFIPDHCGTCTRCLEACPTACILPDRTIDATRCLSYLTIELKGTIPIELRSSLGEWIFGCDICQQVCPWNERFATEQWEPAFAPRPGVPYAELARELEESTTEKFNQKFQGSPVKRAKRRGYLRNVAVALGNAGQPSTVPALTQALLREAEPLVRSHAAWALGQIVSAAACQALMEASQSEQDAAVLVEIQRALQNCSGVETGFP